MRRADAAKPADTRGLAGQTIGDTSICSVNQTQLIYRGYEIADLAAHATFEEVAFLLLVVISSTIAQLYGEKLANRIVWWGFVPLLVASLLMQLVLNLPPSVEMTEFRADDLAAFEGAVDDFGYRNQMAVYRVTLPSGGLGLNWTPKRHGTVSPALAERIKAQVRKLQAQGKDPTRSISAYDDEDEYDVDDAYSLCAVIRGLVGQRPGRMCRVRREASPPRAELRGAPLPLRPRQVRRVRHAAARGDPRLHSQPARAEDGGG